VNEATLTQRLKEETVLRLPPPVVFTKHNDGSTSGVADVTVCAQLETWWVEVKFVRPKSTTMREVLKHPIQEAQCRLRELATRRMVYLVYHAAGRTEIWLPSALRAQFDAGVAMPAASPRGQGLEPYSALRALGSCASPGHDHGLLARVIRGD
jgi:hypothetical protein